MNTQERRRKDRREDSIDFDRRHFDRRDRAFVFYKTVYLSDTNAFGNTYFAKYFEWQGMARESFLSRVLVQDLKSFFSSGIKLITAEAEQKYLGETRAFDQVEIRIKLGRVRHASAELLFTFTNVKTKGAVGVGRQLVTFANAYGKLIAIPESVRANLKPFTRESASMERAVAVR